MEDEDLPAGDARIPAGTLARYLRGGFSVDEFVADHRGVTRHEVVEFLARAVEATTPESAPAAGTMVRDKEDVRRVLGAETDALRRHGVRRLALFGSFVRGEVRPGSDVDLLVEFYAGAETYRNIYALSRTLEDLLGRKVELLTPAGLSPHLGPRILAEAEDVAVPA